MHVAVDQAKELIGRALHEKADVLLLGGVHFIGGGKGDRVVALHDFIHEGTEGEGAFLVDPVHAVGGHVGDIRVIILLAVRGQEIGEQGDEIDNAQRHKAHHRQAVPLETHAGKFPLGGDVNGIDFPFGLRFVGGLAALHFAPVDLLKAFESDPALRIASFTSNYEYAGRSPQAGYRKPKCRS